MSEPDATCFYCEERIERSEILERTAMNWGDGDFIHQECFVRMGAGSVGHQLRRCPCHGGTEEDPPGLTRREAARAACELHATLHSLRN